jgi:hypothetical protein
MFPLLFNKSLVGGNPSRSIKKTGIEAYEVMVPDSK